MVQVQGRHGGFFSGKARLLSSCEVELILEEPTLANTRLEVCLQVLNPETGCSSSNADATGVQLKVWASTPDYSLGPYTMSGVVLSGVDKPALEIAEISESSSVRRSMNTLKIMFRSNVELVAGSVVSITGLTGTAANRATAPNTAVAVGDPYYHTNPLQVTGMSSHLFKQDLKWDPVTGTLEITTTSTIQAKTNVIFSTEVQNGAQTQTLTVNPKISIMSPVTASTPLSLCTSPGQSMVEMITPTQVKGTVLKSTCEPSFVVRKIGQSSPYPEEANMLTGLILPPPNH